MANLPVPAPISDADYEAIEGAVMETARGRWFLAEYARRNRNADTTMLLKALDRIEGAIRGERSVDPVDRIRFDLVEMAKAIARTKAEIAAMKPDADHHGKFGEAGEELDSVVQQTEAATSDILACAERVQEMAWTLRERGVEPEVCDLLDANATEVYTACSFQDLTGQRTRKVIGVLHYLEGRINAMIEIWGLGGAMSAQAAESRAVASENALLNGPARLGQGLGQADVDMVMGPAAVSRDDDDIGPPLQPVEEVISEPPEDSIESEEQAELTHFDPPALDHSPLIPAQAGIQVQELGPRFRGDEREMTLAEAPAPEIPQPISRATAPASDPLEAFMALSAEEKIALFT
jgi:chemotaxis protein CheZ